MIELSIEEARHDLETAIFNQYAVSTGTGRGAIGTERCLAPHTGEEKLIDLLSDSSTIKRLKIVLRSLADVPAGSIVKFYRYAGKTKINIKRKDND